MNLGGRVNLMAVSDRFLRGLDVAIVIFCLTLAFLLLYRHLSSTQVTESSLPAPFPLPTKRWAFPQPKLVDRPLKVDDQTRVMAESFLIRGSQEMDRKNFGQALGHFRRAQMMVPNELRYARQVQAAERGAELASAWLKVQEDLRQSRNDAAWEDFGRISATDIDFFLSRGREMAEHLQAKGQTASAVSLLLTYCRAVPSDLRGRDTLSRGVASMGINPQRIEELMQR
jgi:hypothetical protein